MKRFVFYILMQTLFTHNLVYDRFIHDSIYLCATIRNILKPNFCWNNQLNRFCTNLFVLVYNMGFSLKKWNLVTEKRFIFNFENFIYLYVSFASVVQWLTFVCTNVYTLQHIRLFTLLNGKTICNVEWRTSELMKEDNYGNKNRSKRHIKSKRHWMIHSLNETRI